MVYYSTVALVSLPMWYQFISSEGSEGPFLNFYTRVKSVNKTAFVFLDLLLWNFWSSRLSVGVAQVSLTATIVSQIWYFYSMQYILIEYNSFGVLADSSSEVKIISVEGSEEPSE